MEKISYDIQFNVPAFLGDAEQQSAWRTPPLKALIQHWWRIAVAKEHGYDYNKIRESEGRLFGHAWLDNGSWAMRSRVRIKLDSFKSGNLDKWEFKQTKISHKEVGFPVGSDLYMGFGPLLYSKANKTTELKHSAIKANETNQLTLVYPKQAQATFLQVMQLIHWFGALGGRSRNAWGSVYLHSDAIIKSYDLQNIKSITRPLADCLQLDWPHAIGSDEHGLLIWQTPERDNWQLVIKDLAITKINFRTALAFPHAKPSGFEDRHLLAYPVTKAHSRVTVVHDRFEDRHLLAYPVTNHPIKSWGDTGRLANQIRFKIAKTVNNKFVGVIFHLPCALPKDMSQNLQNPPSIKQQITIWQTVHQSLTKQTEPKLTRISQ